MSKNREENSSTNSDRCLLQSARGCSYNLYNHFQFANAFLICSGPSVRGLDLSCLGSRGILTCTVNNAGTLFRSNLWVAYDNPGNFCDVIWRDPGMLKFIPIQRFDQPIRIRNDRGELVVSDETPRNMPATIGYRTNLKFRPEHWLNEGSINCGDKFVGAKNTNKSAGSRSVMLVALRLLYYLGIRRVFLLGCDFRMSYGGDNYAFAQTRTKRSIRSNNNLYRTLCEKFKLLLPHFEVAGFEVYNCSPASSLAVFPFVDLEKALEVAKNDFPKVVNTNGMYDKSLKSEGQNG